MSHCQLVITVECCPEPPLGTRPVALVFMVLKVLTISVHGYLKGVSLQHQHLRGGHLSGKRATTVVAAASLVTAPRAAAAACVNAGLQVLMRLQLLCKSEEVSDCR